MSSDINWTNPKSKISKYFTVGEATWLPRLKMYYTPTEEEKSNIIKLAERLDKARELLNKPFTVNVWIRPTTIDPKTGKQVDYNALVGGAKNSQHRLGLAVDLEVKGMVASEVRAALKPHLEEINLYMEDDVSWCHFQLSPPRSGNRIFKP